MRRPVGGLTPRRQAVLPHPARRVATARAPSLRRRFVPVAPPHRARRTVHGLLLTVVGVGLVGVWASGAMAADTLSGASPARPAAHVPRGDLHGVQPLTLQSLTSDAAGSTRALRVRKNVKNLTPQERRD
jgi:hypothetical protein